MVLVYLPTKLGHLWGVNVGKYTRTMDDHCHQGHQGPGGPRGSHATLQGAAVQHDVGPWMGHQCSSSWARMANGGLVGPWEKWAILVG